MTRPYTGKEPDEVSNPPLTNELRKRMPNDMEWVRSSKSSQVIHPSYTIDPRRPLCGTRGRFSLVGELLESPAMCAACLRVMRRIGKLKAGDDETH